MSKYLFTSESVTEGHPDKLADQISDAILDAIVAEDPMARVAVETMVTTGLVLVSGEITTKAYVDIQKVVRETILAIGYNQPELGFHGDDVSVLITIDEQSPDIAQGVDLDVKSKELGAGDQGLMFGYACQETSSFMPLSIELSHQLARRLAEVRHQEILDYLGPDGKTQVTLEYDHEGEIKRIDTIVISTQHADHVSLETIEKDLMKQVIQKVVPTHLLDDTTKYLINPTGRFVIGGPKGDTGLTGRKIIVDTYGGKARHGGGAFSGKDATKVDRSAAYMARYIAKNLVAADLAKECEVQLAYAIGVVEPVSVRVDTFGTGTYDDEVLVQAVRDVFDLRPASIIDALDLRRPIFKDTAAYGHFGRNEPNFSWERTDRVSQLLDALG